MTDIVSFDLFQTVEDVPYEAKNGKDGESLFVTSQSSDSSNIIVNLSDGSTITIPKGTNGTNGTNGVGIDSIDRTGGDGSAGSLDTYTITYTDATTSTFTIQNGDNGTNGVGVQSATIETNSGSPNYKKLILTLTDSTEIVCGTVVGTDGISVVSFSVDGAGDVTATMSDTSELAVGNIYGGISAIEAEVVGDDLILTFPLTGVFNAGDVRGPQGDTGATGATGATGPAGPTFTVRDNLASGLNTRTSTDSYYIDDISACTNAPAGVGAEKAFLEIRAFNPTNIIQTLTLISGVIYTRFYTGSWTNWFYYTGTDSGS